MTVVTIGGGPVSEVDRLLASFPDAVIGVRPDLTVFLWNAAAEALTGRSATRALERLLPECLGQEARLIRHLGETIRLAEGRAEPESEVTTLDGRVIPVSLLTAPIHGPSGGLRGAVAVLRDLSRIRALEEEIIALREVRITAADRARATQTAVANALNSASERIEKMTQALNRPSRSGIAIG